MSEVIDFMKDELVVSLRKLEAGNLYFSIILKKQLTKNLNDPDSVFTFLKGYEDISVLRDIYIKEGSFNYSQSILTLLLELDSCYMTLKGSYLANEVMRKKVIEEYEGLKKHFVTNVPSKEYMTFLMQNVDGYFQKETSLSLLNDIQKKKSI